VIGLIGLASDVSIDIRERFSVSLSRLESALNNLSKAFNETVILSTCNRTEIYFETEYDMEKAREQVFRALNWDKNLMKYTFLVNEKKAVEHLMKVSCGFHSRILGEDQILGQIKDAYDTAVKLGTAKTEMQKLFQSTISCGKEFRTKCQLFKIPVSTASIAVKDSIERKAEVYMIIGYGDIGKLAAKYVLDSRTVRKLYIVVRNADKVKADELIKDNPLVRVIEFGHKNNYYSEVQAIISCTSAPHHIIKKAELEDIKLKQEVVIYDLAVPRDVDEEVGELPLITLFNIDNLNSIDEENKNKRREIMHENTYIIDKYIESFMEWKSLREIIPYIEKIKEHSNIVFKQRYKVFKNKQKTKAPEELAKVLIKSASDVYANRAIEILKEEKLKGREEECLRILQKIFPMKEQNMQ
jgi:glutamyl-tRNA reductase